MLLQLEEATVILLQNLHGTTDDGGKHEFTVQVLLKSSEKFGPASIRELSVRSLCQLGYIGKQFVSLSVSLNLTTQPLSGLSLARALPC